jgi:hypothetical protein
VFFVWFFFFFSSDDVRVSCLALVARRIVVYCAKEVVSFMSSLL